MKRYVVPSRAEWRVSAQARIPARSPRLMPGGQGTPARQTRRQMPGLLSKPVHPLRSISSRFQIKDLDAHLTRFAGLRFGERGGRGDEGTLPWLPLGEAVAERLIRVVPRSGTMGRKPHKTGPRYSSVPHPSAAFGVCHLPPGEGSPAGDGGRGTGTLRAGCHTSDVGHWFAMTPAGGTRDGGTPSGASRQLPQRGSRFYSPRRRHCSFSLL